MALPPGFFDEARGGLKVRTFGSVESFRLGRISPGSGQLARFWEFSSGEMDNELLFQTYVGSWWKKGTECRWLSWIPLPVFACWPPDTPAGLPLGSLGLPSLAESSACFQTSLGLLHEGGFAQTP